MDPVNRNKIWSTIKALKQNRIVVLTTHNMSEADELGDTIALMSNGRMRAMGSALFLKNRYGAGYQLQLLINPEFHQQIQTIIKQLLPGCEIIHSAGHNAVNADTVAAGNSGNNASGHGNFTIGLKRKSLRQLPAFFAWMEAEEKRWRAAVARELAPGQEQQENQVLREWSLSNSTLEEVFLRLCAAEKNINERLAGSSESEEAAEAEAAADREILAAMEEKNVDIEAKCMLCRQRSALERVTLYSKAGLAVDFANLLCGVCSHSTEAAQLISGPSASSSAPAPDKPAELSPGEDDAPIQLHATNPSDVASAYTPLLVQPAVQAAVSKPATAPKGEMTDGHAETCTHLTEVVESCVSRTILSSPALEHPHARTPLRARCHHRRVLVSIPHFGVPCSHCFPVFLLFQV
jgi:ABC-type multidrug transport system ATPase subunit